jgi:hypothetical protein
MKGTLVYNDSLSPCHAALNFIHNVHIIIQIGKIAYGFNHGKLWGPFNKKFNTKLEIYDHVLYAGLLDFGNQWCNSRIFWN